MSESNLTQSHNEEYLEYQLKLNIPIEDIACGICNNTVIQPVTLLCQHTFCYECMYDMKKNDAQSNKCPSCRFPFIMPKKKSYNIMLETLIRHVTPELQLPKRDISIKKREMEDTVREELRQEILGAVMNETLPNQRPFVQRNTTNQNNHPNRNINRDELMNNLQFVVNNRNNNQ